MLQSLLTNPSVLVLKPNIGIVRTAAGEWLLGNHELSEETLVSCPEDPDHVLRLRSPWRREPGMRLPRGYNTFHLCLSNGKKEIFIPMTFLSTLRERN